MSTTCTAPECKRPAKILKPVPLCGGHYQQARRCRLAGQAVVFTVLREPGPALRPLRTRVKESTYAFLGGTPGATPGERARQILEAAEAEDLAARKKRRSRRR